MGKRGPKPASETKRARVKIGRKVVLTGSGESEVLFARFRPPAQLGKRAKQIWREIGKLLAEAGVLREGHARLLWLLCGALERLEEAREFISDAQKGSSNRLASCVFRTRNGYPVLAPWFQAELRLSELAAKLLAQFGMAPSDEELPRDQQDAMKILGGWQQYARASTVMGTGRNTDSTGLLV